jgi:RNA polymerase sigma-70 factor, ECF subfamily
MRSRGDDELHARFQREAIPLLERLSLRALGLTRDRHDAEDLLQETMLFAYIGFHSYQEGTNLKAWLMRIMQNRWVSQCRRRGCRPAETSVRDYAELPAADILVTPSAESVALDSISDAEVRAALLEVQEDVRTVVYYAYFEDLSHNQIASLLGIPSGTVMSRAHRGRRQLRAALEGAGMTA